MIDPLKFEALKKDLAAASARYREAECKANAAAEEMQSAKFAHDKAYMEVRKYFNECMGLEGCY